MNFSQIILAFLLVLLELVWGEDEEAQSLGLQGLQRTDYPLAESNYLSFSRFRWR